jgi:hypothetical protein
MGHGHCTAILSLDIKEIKNIHFEDKQHGVANDSLQ